MKTAILAMRNTEVLNVCKRLMNDLGGTYSVVSDAMELKLSLERRQPDIVIAEEYVESEPIYDLISEHADRAWVVLTNLLETWGGARYIATLAPHVAVLTARPAVYDLTEAIQAALTRDDVWFVQMCNEFSRAWTKALEAFPGTFGLDVTDDRYRMAQAAWLKMHFEPELPAPCQAVSTLAVLCRIVRQKMTGTLEITRDNAFVRVSWFQGMACNVETDIRQLDYLWFKAWWMEQSKKSAESSENQDETEEMTCRREWIKATLAEIVLWRRGDMRWKMCSILPGKIKIPPNVWHALANALVFRISSREVLDTMRALLPFSFKLRTSIDDVKALFSYTETRAVVERLQKSDTLAELLVYLPQGYPVHQTIYLLLAQSCLDID